MDEDNDLNLNNYSLFEILGLFDLPYDYEDIHVKKANEKCESIRKKINDKNIIEFYNKAYIIINCINKFRESRKIANSRYINNESDDNKLVMALKQKSDLGNTENIINLLQQILNDNDDLVVNYGESLRPKDPINPTNTGTNYEDLTKNNNIILNTFPNKVVPGTINPVKRIIHYTNLHLSSSFRDKYYNSDPCNFHYNLPSEIKNVLSLRLASIEIPNAWYLFSYLKKNNRFKIEITTCIPCEGKKCFVYDIVVPDGNYDSDTLIGYLNKTFFYQNNNEDDKNLKYIKISLDKFNNKTSFSLVEDAPEGTVFSLHFTEKNTDNMMMTLGWTLGFRLSRYLKIEDSIQSEGLFDAGGDRYIFFALNDYQYNVNENNIVLFDETSIYDNILGKIPMVNGKLCLIIDENDGVSFTKTRRYNGPVNLKKMQISVMDKFGDIIDINHMDFSFTLELEILYERNGIV